MKFNHLNVPTHWQNYWTRYPEGHTILEALISWVSQVDDMVDNQNKLTDNVAQFRNEIDDFVGRFDERLQDEVTHTLKDWQASGFLDVVISDALQWQLDDHIEQLKHIELNKIDKGNVLKSDLNKNSIKFDGTWFEPEFLTELNDGVINTTNVGDKSITSDKLANKSVSVGNHLKDGYTSTNLHNMEKDLIGYTVDLETGEIKKTESDFRLSEEIDISDITTFTTVGYHNFVFFDKNGDLLLPNIYLAPEDRTLPQTVTKPSEAKTVRVAYSPDVAVVPRFNIGATLLHFEPYYQGIKYFDNDKKSHFKQSTNLLNKETEIKNTGIVLTGENAGELEFFEGRNTSQKIDVKPDETIFVKNGINLVEFDIFGNFIRYYFYVSSLRESGEAVKLTNRTFSVQIVYSASLASVQLQVNRGGTLLPWEPFEPIDLTSQTGRSSSPLYNGTLLNVGDSIAQAYGLFGYHGYIAAKYKMNLINYARGGATIRNITSDENNHTVMEQVNKAINAGLKPTHIIVNGNTNDWGAYGTVSDGYNSALDNTIYADAFEEVIRALRKNFPEAKIIYVSAHKMRTRSVTEKAEYTRIAYEICDKYSISYVDIFNKSQLNTYFEQFVGKYTISPTDATHPNDLGYEFGYNNLVESVLNNT